MIGHELTALHGLDHAQTLAVVLPAMLDIQREAKQDKLVQYAERVWGISFGTPNERISAAIERTREFFERLGVGTTLSAYGLGKQHIDTIIEQLKAHGMVKLGERQTITPEVSRKVLEAAL